MKKTEGISDGYHTFGELYEHRHMLFRALCRVHLSWKSKKHNDGTMFKGWFIAGTTTPKGEMITYHIPIKYWRLFSKNKTLKRAPKFDGHISDDVLKRLRDL